MTELGPRGSVGDDEGHPDDGPRFAGLRPDFDDLGTGHHVALFYESLDAQRRVAAEFVGSALDRAQQCLYLLDRNDPAAVRSAFRGGVSTWLPGRTTTTSESSTPPRCISKTGSTPTGSSRCWGAPPR